MAGGAGENKVEVSFIKDASFALPGVEIAGQTVATAKLREILEARVGRPVDGILGYDLISRFVIEIDYRNARPAYLEAWWNLVNWDSAAAALAG